MNKYNILAMAYEQQKSQQEIIAELHEQGAFAKSRKIGIQSCPYPGNSDAGKAWKRGYANAGFGESI